MAWAPGGELRGVLQMHPDHPAVLHHLFDCGRAMTFAAEGKSPILSAELQCRQPTLHEQTASEVIMTAKRVIVVEVGGMPLTLTVQKPEEFKRRPHMTPFPTWTAPTLALHHDFGIWAVHALAHTGSEVWLVPQAQLGKLMKWLASLGVRFVRLRGD